MKYGRTVLAFMLVLCVLSFPIGPDYSVHASSSKKANKQQPRIFKSVQDFVKIFNQQGSYNINNYKVKEVKGEKVFITEFYDGYLVLTGVLNTDNSIRSLSFQSDVIYLTKEEQLQMDEEGIEGDLGIERALYVQQIVSSIYNGSDYSSSVLFKVYDLIGLIPSVDPGERRVISKKITIDGVTYSMYVSNSDVFNFKVSK